jgi:hypothetical protein
VAASIKQKLGLDVELIKGDRGEFTVWVGDKLVSKKSWLVFFPSEQKVVKAVKAALA